MSVEDELKELERKKALEELKKAVAEAQEAASKARTAQISAMIPDLSAVKQGTLAVEGESPLFAGVLAHHALKSAAEQVDESVRRKVGLGNTTKGSILVTTNADLATADAVYVQTESALRHLTERAMLVVGDSPGAGGAKRRLLPSPAILGAAASALPALLSLMSTNRTVKTFAGTVDTMSAAVAIAGNLQDNANTSVYLDDLRLLDNSHVLEAAVMLDRYRARLADRLENQKEPDDDEQQLLDDITAFLVSAHASPSGDARSPIVTAALYERLHEVSDEDQFSHVLWVNGVTASSQQAIDDRPLWFNEKVSILGTVSVPWALIETGSSEVISAGVATGTVQLTGEIGKSFQIESVKTVQ